jgi:hypothetical protein
LGVDGGTTHQDRAGLWRRMAAAGRFELERG